MASNFTQPLTPTPQVLRQTSIPVRRYSTSGTLTPQQPAAMPCAVRIMAPSGATTLGQSMHQEVAGVADTTCPTCGNVYMPDAIFCRHCGQKRESSSVAEASLPAYGVGVTGSLTPMAGAATPLPAEPVAYGASQPSHFSISIPAASSYVPPPAAGAATNRLTYAGCASSRVSSYNPPPVQLPATNSYAPPSAVVRQASALSLAPASVQMLPNLPAVPAAGASVTAAAAPGYAPVAGLPMAAQSSLLLSPADLPTPVEPQVPPSLTAGIPDPASIERQKHSYAKGLDDQLKHGTDVLAQQLKQQSDYLFALADQRKRQYALQVDQEIKQREMDLAQQHNEQLLLLQQAAQQQKSALEHQANALLLEYNQKKAQEDLVYQQYQFQKRQYDTQIQYNEEMKDLQLQQAAAQQQVAQQKVAIAQQAVVATQQAQATAQQAAQAQYVARAASGIMAAPTSYSMTVPSYAAPVYVPPASTTTATWAAPVASPSTSCPNPTAYWSASGTTA